MRDGAYKLLLACSKREQVLHASKNLLTSNTRIRAYLTQLQKQKEEEDDLLGSARRWVGWWVGGGTRSGDL